MLLCAFRRKVAAQVKYSLHVMDKNEKLLSTVEMNNYYQPISFVLMFSFEVSLSKWAKIEPKVCKEVKG